MRFLLRSVSSALALMALQGCGAAQSDPAYIEQVEAAPSEMAKAEEVLASDEAVVRFSDILDQYRALNERLDNVAARLQIANAPLCPATVRDPGYTVHTLSDYPLRLQQVAKGLLNVDDGLSVRTVRTGSPAAAAGLRPADRLIGINGQRFPGGQTQQKFYDRAAQTAYAAPSARLTVSREIERGRPEVMSFKIMPETICGYPAHVVFDEYVNGHTDGETVWITSELMRSVDDDINLALIVAHEMAHAIAGHLDLNPTDEQRKALELTADSMALVMLERAGFDINAAIEYWTRADNPQRMSQSRSNTHPSISQRLNNFEAAREVILQARRDKVEADFTNLPAPIL